MGYVESPVYGEAWDLAIKVQSLGITGPWSSDWAKVFKLGGSSGVAVVGYDPVELQRVAGERFAQLGVAGSSLSYGGVALPDSMAPQVSALWQDVAQAASPTASMKAAAPPRGGLLLAALALGAFLLLRRS